MTYKMLMNFDVLGETDLGRLHLTERGQEWASLITWEPEPILRKEPKPTPDTDRIDLRETLPSLKEILKHFDQLKDADDPLIFPGKTVEALHAGLWTDARRHFAVLTGLSGTGKDPIGPRVREGHHRRQGCGRDYHGPARLVRLRPAARPREPVATRRVRTSRIP